MGDAAPAEPRGARRQLFDPRMRSRARRLGTFRQWPHDAPVSAQALVEAGFFYVGPTDEVQCFCCGGVLTEWRRGDCPLRAHLTYFPSCEYLSDERVGIQEVLSSLQDVLDAVDGQILSVLQGVGREEPALPNDPEYPDMEMEEMRLSTFENWPQDSSVDPEHLARAGFFYTGRNSGEVSITLIQVNFGSFTVLLFLQIPVCTCLVVKNHILPPSWAVSLAACAEFISTFNSCLGTEGSTTKYLLASRRGKGDVF